MTEPPTGDDAAFHVHIRPLEDLSQFDPSYAADFYVAIGRIVAHWGRMEQTLNWLLRLALKVAAKEGLLGSVPLRSVDRTIDELKRVFRDTRLLEGRNSSLRTILSSVKECMKDRTRLIHAQWTAFEDGPPPRMRFADSENVGDELRIASFAVSLEQLNGLAKGIYAIETELIPFLIFTASLQHGEGQAATE